MVPLADSKDSPNAALTAYRGSAPGALRKIVTCVEVEDFCGKVTTKTRQIWSRMVHSIVKQKTLFRGLKDKKGPRKRVPGTFLNNFMCCQLFFRTNS